MDHSTAAADVEHSTADVDHNARQLWWTIAQQQRVCRFVLAQADAPSPEDARVAVCLDACVHACKYACTHGWMDACMHNCMQSLALVRTMNKNLA
eukprot:365979-Chlamydomonas_euryale.AAC.4